ncbi:MAG: acetyl/propionyl/methylcrotonyl-CoA carboxylase subunit alpha [Halioglobus sp.]
MFTKILIANRGEIACRVMRTARQMGIQTVAVYSDADADALHVREADEAVHIGPSPARDSYLQGQRILDVAQRCGAQAIHPGYGFLSENAQFSADCAERGIAFIGPGAEAIAAMGSKSAAKAIMSDADVPLVPGYHGDDQDPELLRAEAEKMGYPVLLKASAGGGGKGMRQVWNASEFDEALATAKREAMAGFGDDSMLVEKYLTRPRHVEIQVFFDHHGNGVYLAERDCSVQRRHQKVIEEAPAPGVSDALRKAMGESALRAARAIDYRGAGTVEFLLDEDGSFYFMEMNTRLQVEHPVTEMITGLDLVEWQLRVASGETLPLAQDEVTISGHAFEARVYAEDAENDFLPATGQLAFLQAPEESRYVRVDTGVLQGDEISVYYDPMIAKLVVWDESRERALQRLAGALAQYRIGGTTSNLEFLYNLATCEPFVQADVHTRFIEEHHERIFHQRDEDLEHDLPLAALALLLHRRGQDERGATSDPWSPWNRHNAWRMNEPHVHRLQLLCHGNEHTVAMEECNDGYLVHAAGVETRLGGELDGDQLALDIAGHRLRATLAVSAADYTLFLPDRACHFSEVLADTGEADQGAGEAGLSAPMNGTIITLLTEPGAEVEADDALLVMEAMKMEHTIRAPKAGKVTAFYFQPGELVDGGSLLLEFEAYTES